jgi:uncharacterized protein YjbI with pentapeptide repeats
MKLHGVKACIDVHDTDISGSSFDDVNMSGSTIRDANLAGCSLRQVNMSGAAQYGAYPQNRPQRCAQVIPSCSTDLCLWIFQGNAPRSSPAIHRFSPKSSTGWIRSL